MKRCHWPILAFVVAHEYFSGFAAYAVAQQPKLVPPEEAALVVEGVVRELYTSERENRTDYLVEITVSKSEARHIQPDGARQQYPAPGELLTIYVWQRHAPTGRLGQVQNPLPPPAERSRIKAFLTPREQGGWQATFPKWYELLNESVAGVTTGDPPPKRSPTDDATDATHLGMTLERIQFANKTGLRVTSIERGGAAQQAGLEVGDVLVGAGEASVSLESVEQLLDMTAANPQLDLLVVDVNTGRTAKITIVTRAAPARETEAQNPIDNSPPREQPSDEDDGPSLGIAAERVTLGQRTALKVSQVEPNGAAARAGIEVGDILVKANGAPLTGPEQLAAALRKSGSAITLTVRDVRTGRDVPVEVPLGGSPVKPAPTLPTEQPSANKTAPGQIGVVTELAFYDNEAAVKVTEVERGSPAERAGLQVGTIIVQAGDKPVLHPSDLIDAERAAKGSLRLSIVAPGSRRKSTIEVRL
ncbi:MAG: PDZ domain-containing protein [Pirellulales bacterium]|nr:PDZ domain-containing protein [Pirellulales bacterium]